MGRSSCHEWQTDTPGGAASVDGQKKAANREAQKRWRAKKRSAVQMMEERTHTLNRDLNRAEGRRDLLKSDISRLSEQLSQCGRAVQVVREAMKRSDWAGIACMIQYALDDGISTDTLLSDDKQGERDMTSWPLLQGELSALNMIEAKQHEQATAPAAPAPLVPDPMVIAPWQCSSTEFFAGVPETWTAVNTAWWSDIQGFSGQTDLASLCNVPTQNIMNWGTSLPSVF